MPRVQRKGSPASARWMAVIGGIPKIKGTFIEVSIRRIRVLRLCWRPPIVGNHHYAPVRIHHIPYFPGKTV